MSTRFGALGHDNVATGVYGPLGVLDLATHGNNENVIAVTEINDVRRYAESGHERGGATFDEQFYVLDERVGECGEQVNAKRLVGRRLGAGNLIGQDFGAHGAGAEAAVTTSVRYSRGESGVGNTTHTGQHDGVFNL